MIAVGIIAALVAVLVVVTRSSSSSTSREARAAAPAQPATAVTTSAPDPLTADITKQQDALRNGPDNSAAWAALALDYVQQAKITVDPSYYPKATGALQKSLALNSTDNVDAFAGQAALKAAEHDFTAARDWAQRGLRIDPINATLLAALDDADTQLGRYSEAFDAAQRLNEVQPGVAAFTRAEYVFELRGDIPKAEAAMRSALTAALAPADMAFAHYYLSELAFNRGDPRAALAEAKAGQRVDPSYLALLQTKARAEAALGQTQAAIADYQTVVSALPQPQYLVEYGELLQSLGRQKEAQQQYSLFGTETRLFTANGVTLDTDPTLFYADHGDPKKALSYGETGIKIRPFIEMDDAYAWALHANGRDAEALTWEAKAMQLGTRNALFYFHKGMMEKSLGRNSAARADLQTALSINPYFSPYQVPKAKAALAQLGSAP